MKVKVTFATCLFSVSLVAQESPDNQTDPFAFYEGQDWRPYSTVIQTDYIGELEAGLTYTGDDSFMFGQYNGLYEQGSTANLAGFFKTWHVDSEAIDYWQVEARDLGLETRSATFEMGAVRDFKFVFGLDQQKQVKNNTGQTPFQASGNMLLLPSDWVAGLTTSDMTAFDASSRRFRQSVKRSRLDLEYLKDWGPEWRFTSELSTEEKTGVQAKGGAFFANTSNGHAVILPSPVDYTTHKIDLGLGYHQADYQVQASYLFSKFENDNASVMWQNPYSAYQGPGVAYPDGVGQLALEPDNDLHQLRVMGNYLFSRDLRLSGDLSFSRASQDQAYLPYTSNPALTAGVLPRTNLDGEVDTTTAKANLYYRITRDLNAELRYRYEDRDNTSPRDAYQSVTGDSWAPTDPKYRYYNSPHSRNKSRYEIEGTYRLPYSTRISMMYGYEETDRYNHAVETTEEDILKLTIRSQPLADLSTRLELTDKDRGASVYYWDQSYLALHDPLLINETPDNQRFTNHPLLSQFYLSNREQLGAKLNLTYLWSQQWQTALDVHYLDNDYDKSTFGLLEDQRSHATLSAVWVESKDLSMSVYLSYDKYENEQAGRAFNGGIEKNPFEIYQPLPQASDPTRDWYVAPEDESKSLGVSVNWTAIPKKLEMDWDYRYSNSESNFDDIWSGGAYDLSNMAIPMDEDEEHHFTFNSLYHLREDLSLKFNYQYYRFKGENWAFDQVSPMSIDKVLGSGQRSANDQMHVFQLSIIYRIK